MKKYQIIYADPPWRYDRSGVQGSAEKIYPTMTQEDICSLPVADIADKDAVLFLWATFPKLREALQTIKAWGFQYPIKEPHQRYLQQRYFDKDEKLLRLSDEQRTFGMLLSGIWVSERF